MKKPRAAHGHTWFCLSHCPQGKVHLWPLQDIQSNTEWKLSAQRPAIFTSTPGSDLEFMWVDVPVSSSKWIHTFYSPILGICQGLGVSTLAMPSIFVGKGLVGALWAGNFKIAGPQNVAENRRQKCMSSRLALSLTHGLCIVGKGAAVVRPAWVPPQCRTQGGDTSSLGLRAALLTNYG